MKKILHMTPPEVQNGVYRYIFNHLPYIEQKEYQFAFLTKAAEELKRTEEYERYHFPVYRLKTTQHENREEFEDAIRSVINEGYDIIHLHTSSWNGFLIEEIAMKMGIRVIVHSHSTGIDILNGPEREKRLFKHNAYKQQFTMEYATDICACSRLAADWLFGPRIPRESIKILPNAIDVDKYRYQSDIRRKIRSDLHLNNKIVVGHVGRYSFQKNQEFLIRAFCEAHKRNKNLFLLCIGQGEMIDRILDMVKEFGLKGSVRCLSWKENVWEYLQGMDLFCLPSRFEGLPISLIEAQASGLRCLISDTISREAILTDNVKTLPLEECIWTEAILNADYGYAREGMAAQVKDAGYDIKDAAGQLKELYKG